MALYKLGVFIGADEREHEYPQRFMREPITGSERLCIAGNHDYIGLLEQLLVEMKPPYYLLYVLHTARHEHEAARYQSPLLTREVVMHFFRQFADFFAQDARHDIWVHSQPDHSTIIWDRHNLFYAYGPLDAWSEALQLAGWFEGTVDIPFPHAHHFHDEYDGQEDALFTALAWGVRPLQPEDEQ